MQTRAGLNQPSPPQPGRGRGDARFARANRSRYRSPVPAAPTLAPPRARLSFWLLLLFLGVLYACVGLQWPELEKYAPAQTIAIAALLVLFLEKGFAGSPIRIASPETWLLFAFVVVAGFSSFGALWPRYALEQGIGLLKMVALYLLVLNTADTWKKLRLTSSVAVLAGLFPAVGALLLYPENGWAQGARAGWIGIFLNSNDLAYSLVLLMPLALGLISGARWFMKPVYLAAAAAYMATILLTFSRGGLLAVCVVALLCLLRWGSGSLRLFGACVLAASVIFVTSFWTRSDTQGLVDHATLDLRWLTVKIGAAMLADHPVLGVGIGCSPLGWPLYAPPDYPADGWLGVHNTLVQVFTEVGMVGGSIFVALLATSLIGLHRATRICKLQRRTESHRLASAIEIALYGFLVCGLSGGYVLSWFPYLLLGMASAARLLAEPTPAAKVVPMMRPVQRAKGRASRSRPLPTVS